MVCYLCERNPPPSYESAVRLYLASCRLSLPKTLYGANAFEINDIQEQETWTSRVRPLQCNACYIALKLVTLSIRRGQVTTEKRAAQTAVVSLFLGKTRREASQPKRPEVLGVAEPGMAMESRETAVPGRV